MLSERARQNLYSAAVAVFVFLSVWLGLTLTRGEGRVAAIWMSNGVLLALLLTRGETPSLPLILIGYLANALANRVSGDQWLQASSLAAVNIFEVGIAYWLLTRRGEEVDLRQSHGLGRFVLWAVIVSPLVCALIGTTVVAAAGRGDFFPTLRVWFLADALGMAVIGPVVFVILQRDTLAALFRVTNLGGTGLVLALLFASAWLTWSRVSP